VNSPYTLTLTRWDWWSVTIMARSFYRLDWVSKFFFVANAVSLTRFDGSGHIKSKAQLFARIRRILGAI
jgi:hypothetical protein